MPNHSELEVSFDCYSFRLVIIFTGKNQAIVGILHIIQYNTIAVGYPKVIGFQKVQSGIKDKQQCFSTLRLLCQEIIPVNSIGYHTYDCLSPVYRCSLQNIAFLIKFPEYVKIVPSPAIFT